MSTEERKRSRSGSQKRRQRRLSIGLEPLDLDTVDERAEAAGMSRSAYIRAAVLGHPGFRAVPRPSVEKKLLGLAVGQLGRVGNNLNQLAHHANLGRMLDANSVAPLLDELREVVAAIMKALDRDY